MNQLESLFEIIGNREEIDENKREAESEVDRLFHEEIENCINQCIQIFNNPLAKEYSISLAIIKTNWCLKETTEIKVINWSRAIYEPLISNLQINYIKLLYTGTIQIQRLAAQGLSLLIKIQKKKSASSIIQSILNYSDAAGGDVSVPCLGAFIEIFTDRRIENTTKTSNLPQELVALTESVIKAFHESTDDFEINVIIEFLTSFISCVPLFFWNGSYLDMLLTGVYNRLCEADVSRFSNLHDMLFEITKCIYPSEEFSEGVIRRVYEMIEIGFNTDDINYQTIAILFWERFCKFERGLLSKNQCKKYCIAASENALPHLVDILLTTPPISHIDESGTEEIDKIIFNAINEMFIIEPASIFGFLKNKIKELIASGESPESTCILISSITPKESYDVLVLKLLCKSFNFILQSISNGVLWHGIQALSRICRNYIDIFRDDTYITSMLSLLRSLVVETTPPSIIRDICNLLTIFLNETPEIVDDAYSESISEIATSISALASMKNSEFVSEPLVVMEYLTWNVSSASFDFCQQYVISNFSDLMENIDRILDIQYETMYRSHQLRVISIAYRKLKNLYPDSVFPTCQLTEASSDVFMGMLQIIHDQKADVEIEAMYVIENLTAIFPAVAVKFKEELFDTLSVVFDRQSPEQIGQACSIYSVFLDKNIHQFSGEIAGIFGRVFPLIASNDVDYFRFYFTEALEALGNIVRTANKIGGMNPEAEESYAKRIIEIASEDYSKAMKDEPESVAHLYKVICRNFRLIILNEYDDFDILNILFNGCYKIFDGMLKCKCYTDQNLTEALNLYITMIEKAPEGFLVYNRNGLRCQRTSIQECITRAAKSNDGVLFSIGRQAAKLKNSF